jgi:O-antigen/teichoic acid export membrane protein
MAIQFLAAYMLFAVALGKQSKLLWINGGAAVFNIVLNLYAIPHWGFRGAAWSTVATEVFILLVAGGLARHYLRYRLDWKTFLKVAVAGAVMATAVVLLKEPSYGWLGLQNLNVILLAGGGAVLYAAVLYLLGAFPEEFRKKLGEKLA